MKNILLAVYILLFALFMPFVALKANNQPETETPFTDWLKEFIPEQYPGSNYNPHNGWYQVYLPEFDLTVSWGLVPLKEAPLKEVEGLFENKSIFIAKEAGEDWTKSSKVDYYPGVGYFVSDYNSATMGNFNVGQVTVIQFDGKPKKFVKQMVNALENSTKKSEIEFVFWLKEFVSESYPDLSIDFHGGWYQSIISQLDLTATWGTMAAIQMPLKNLHGLYQGKSIFIEHAKSVGWEKHPNVDYVDGVGYAISKYDTTTMGDFEVGLLTVIQYDGTNTKDFTQTMAEAWNVNNCTTKSTMNPKKTELPFMRWLYNYIPEYYSNAKMTDHHYWLQAHIGNELVVNWAQIVDGSDLKYMEGHNLVPGQPFFIQKEYKNDWANHPNVTYFDKAGYFITSYDTTTMRNWNIERCTVIQFDGDGFEFSKKMAGEWATVLPSLNEVFKNDFLLGGALNQDLIAGSDPKAAALAIRQYNSATSENAMKWSSIQPKPGVFNWEPADAFMAFCEKNDMVPIGHTLVWKSQVPGWVFKDQNGNQISRDALLARMEDHITQVVGRYKGRIHGWDVVNEALNEDGTLRRWNWGKYIYEDNEEQKYDHIEYAFRYAHAADPDAELYYNDYNLDTRREKCDGAVAIVKHLQSKGVRIDGVGIQLHAGLADETYPNPEDLEYAIKSFAALGVKVMVTELDMKTKRSGYQGADISLMNHSATQDDQAYTPETQKMVADKYAEIFNVILKYKKDISRVTLWGVYDGRSWISGSPLLFDKEYQPKEAYYSVIKAGLENNYKREVK
ncbi:MAG: endo-1,4-beta-xylanase [Prolixibacteraceae bacterium]